TQCLHRLVYTCPLAGSVYSVIACPSALRAGAGVIATAPSVNAAPSIDSATIRIVCLIIVLPGLCYSTMRKLPPPEPVAARPFRTPKAHSAQDNGVHLPRQAQN